MKPLKTPLSVDKLRSQVWGDRVFCSAPRLENGGLLRSPTSPGCKAAMSLSSGAWRVCPFLVDSRASVDHSTHQLILELIKLMQGGSCSLPFARTCFCVPQPSCQYPGLQQGLSTSSASHGTTCSSGPPSLQLSVPGGPCVPLGCLAASCLVEPFSLLF